MCDDITQSAVAPPVLGQHVLSGREMGSVSFPKYTGRHTQSYCQRAHKLLSHRGEACHVCIAGKMLAL